MFIEKNTLTHLQHELASKSSFIDMIPEVIEVGNIDAEGWNDDSKCGKKAKNEDFLTEENDMIIEYHSGSTSKMIGSYISPGKSDKISEVVKEGDEKEGSEGDTLIEIADLLNVSLGKNKEEISLNLDEIKRMENERSISKHITVSIDKMSDKEKIKRILQIFNRKEGANLIELITKYKTKKIFFEQRCQDTSEFMISCLIHHKYKNISWNFINIGIYFFIMLWLELEVKKVLMFGKKNILSEKDKEEKIHALYDNDRLVENEEEINKLATDFYKNLFGPSNNSTIHMNDMNMKKLSAEDRDFEEIHKDFWDIIKKEIWNLPICLLNVLLYMSDWINFQKSECLARQALIIVIIEKWKLLSLNKEINVNWALSGNWNSLTFRRRLVMLGVIGVAVASFTWKIQICSKCLAFAMFSLVAVKKKEEWDPHVIDDNQ
ncbi:hypothetical protein ACJX0J_030019 [Zea mays]